MEIEFLPPPEGLDLSEIRTEAGLLAAIRRETERLDQARKTGERLSRDRIRLITFLAGEVRRRIDHLSSEQKDELHRLRLQAREKEMELRVKEVTDAVEDFVAAVDRPKTTIRFSRITELEDQIRAMEYNLGSDPERYAAFLAEMADLSEKLGEVKSKGALFGGLPDLD